MVKPKDTKAVMFQRLKAPNDPNGNPRRVFVLMNAQGDIVRAIDEGYRGDPDVCRSLVRLPEYEVSATVYKNLLKQFEKETFFSASAKIAWEETNEFKPRG